MHKLTAPKIASYISYLGRVHYRDYNCSFSYDEQTYKYIDELFELLKSIEPVSKNGARSLWLQADRGPIEDYGDFEEMHESGEVESRKEFEEWWLSEFPDDKVWYNFTAVEDAEIGYRMILVGNKFVIEVDSRKEKGYPYDISEFAEWLLESVKDCISMLKAGIYNDIVEKELPPQHRTGTITRKEMWDLFPEARESFFANITRSDVKEFIRLASSQHKEMDAIKGRMPFMTANDFYSFCALGYKENGYEGCDLTPKEQYYRHADGRDEGLGEIVPDSPQAFHE